MKNISLFKAPVNALSTFQMLTVLIKVMQKKKEFPHFEMLGTFHHSQWVTTADGSAF